MGACATVLLELLAVALLGAAEALTKSQYEAKYNTRLQKSEADETFQKPLRKLAFGSCQKTLPHLKDTYDAILRYDPDLFLFTGDNFYTDMNCCTKDCIDQGYQRMVNFEPFKEFKRRVRRFDGVYDDHDFGINDGDATFKFKDHALKIILDFLEKPEDHYRRKRVGAYYSESHVDPDNPKDHVKLIVFDTRYHRGCMHNCICQLCGITFIQSRYIMMRRLVNSLFGIGCDHGADILGEEQWKWFESQLTDSEASAHVIVSSFQVFTTCAVGESWGHFPKAKKRLLDLMEATKPKKPVFVSGDVHYGEVMKKYGLVEFTSSSLTHSIRPYNQYAFMVMFPLYLVSTKEMYMYNNFGTLDFKYNSEKDLMEWEGAIMSIKGEKMLTYRSGDENLYDFADRPDSFFRDYRITKCLSKAEFAGRLLLAGLAVVVPLSLLLKLLHGLVSKLLKWKEPKRKKPKRE